MMLSKYLNILSIMLSIRVIVYSVTLLNIAFNRDSEIAVKIAYFPINRYIRVHQNIIQKLHPKGGLSSTCLILPLVIHPVQIPAIVLGKLSISHT